MSDALQSGSRTTTARERLAAICESLPEATTEGDQHLIFRVRRKTFAYYLEDHHGDGEIAAVFKAAPGLNVALIEQDPQGFFMPAYVGPRGWIAARIDIPEVDWDEITDLIHESYCMVAPRILVDRLRHE